MTKTESYKILYSCVLLNNYSTPKMGKTNAAGLHNAT
jgi:hypothetical protein